MCLHEKSRFPLCAHWRRTVTFSLFHLGLAHAFRGRTTRTADHEAICGGDIPLIKTSCKENSESLIIGRLLPCVNTARDGSSWEREWPAD